MAERICSFPDCPRPVRAKGLCASHYNQQLEGRPLTRLTLPSPTERFWSKVDKDGQDGCWLWTSTLFAKGYGQFWANGKNIRAHRYAYQLLVGPVPEGLTLDHLCRNRSCVNPAHLEPATSRENVLRGEGPTARNRAKTHCKHGHEFTPENTRRYGPNKRFRACRECERAKSRRGHARRRRKARELREQEGQRG